MKTPRQVSDLGDVFRSLVPKYGNILESRPVKLSANSRRVPLYQNAMIVIGEKSARQQYFKDFKSWNRSLTIKDLQLGQLRAFQTETHEMDDRYVQMQQHGSSTYYGMAGNNNIRMLIVNDIPDAVSQQNEFLEIFRLVRVCRAAGMVVFYGVENMQEFRDKQWYGEAISNADCTRIILDGVGQVTAIDDTFGMLPADLFVA